MTILEVDDTVTIFDGSYAVSILAGEIKTTSTTGTYLIGNKRLWDVLAIGDFPFCGNPNGPNMRIKINDLMLKARDNGDIVFISSELVSYYVKPIEVGTSVTIHDGSYSMSVKGTERKLFHAYGCDLKGRIFDVLAVGNFPADDDIGGPYSDVKKNDLMVKARDNGQIVFISSKLVDSYV